MTKQIWNKAFTNSTTFWILYNLYWWR